MAVNELSHHLTNDDCILYASQLLQATKWDYHPFNPLIRFLLQKAVECHEFAYVLYWQLQVFIHPVSDS